MERGLISTVGSTAILVWTGVGLHWLADMPVGGAVLLVSAVFLMVAVCAGIGWAAHYCATH